LVNLKNKFKINQLDAKSLTGLFYQALKTYDKNNFEFYNRDIKIYLSNIKNVYRTLTIHVYLKTEVDCLLQYIFYYLAPSSLPTRNTKVALTKLS
jgi:hypothetical protein